MSTGGRMDRQITVMCKSDTKDTTYNTDTDEWEPLVPMVGSPTVGVRFWAELQDVLPSRSESLKNAAVVSSNPTRLRMRWRNDIDSSMRVIVHGDSDVTCRIIAGPAEIQGRKRRIEMMIERLSS